MKKNIFVLALGILCTISVYSQSKEEKKIIIETIVENDTKLAEFFKSGRFDSIAGMFSPNSQLIVEHRSILEKRENIEEYYQTLFKSGVTFTKFSLQAIEHKVYNDLVLELGVNQIKYSEGNTGEFQSEKLNYMLVWKRSKTGKYQIRAAMWNSIENPCE